MPLLSHTAIDHAIKGKEWFREVVHLFFVIFYPLLEIKLTGTNQFRIEIKSSMIRVFRDTRMMREIAGSEIEEIPRNDICARIDYGCEA